MNFFVISALVNFITSAVLGVFVVYKAKKSRNITFSIFCFFVAFWSISYFFWQIAKTSENALFWCRVLMAGAIFIPVTYLHFVYALVEILNKRKKFLIFSYFLFLLFLVADATPYFVNHVEPLLGFKFWPIAGPLYGIFLIVWVFYVIYSTYLLYKKHKTSSGIIRLQIRYVMIGMIIGFAGGLTNYFLWYRVPIPPVANILISVNVAIIAYSIIRYRLMDIRIVTRKVFVYFVASGFAYGIFYFLIWLYNNFLGGLFTASTYIAGLFIAPAFVLVFLWFYDVLQKVANKYFFYTLYNYQKTINSLSERLNYLNDLGEIVNLIVDTVKQSMQLDRAGVLLVDEKEGEIHYKIAKVIGFNEHNGISLVQDNFLTRHLQKIQKPLVIDELQIIAKDLANPVDRQKFFELSENMKHIEACLCLPLMSSKNLIGIIVLGPKISGDAYTKEDLELLSTLSFQAGIAIDNARLYDQLRDFNKTLQQKVDEQTREIKEAYEVEKKAREELEYLDKVKNQFLMTIQHHLRTPLTSMMGYADLILGGTYGKQNKKTLEVIKKFEASSKILIKMVNEFLDITQFQLGKSVIEPKPGVDIAEMARQIADELKFEADKKGIYLKLEIAKDLPKISADQEKLRAALFNIFDNGVKYTQKGGVSITINSKPQNPNSKPTIMIIAKDTGIGIPKAVIPKLFDSTFERGEEAKKQFVTGRGIGLYIAGQIIKSHQGKIWAESEGEGTGSAFYIELPIS